jgi:hypothetical protein
MLSATLLLFTVVCVFGENGVGFGNANHRPVVPSASLSYAAASHQPEHRAPTNSFDHSHLQQIWNQATSNYYSALRNQLGFGSPGLTCMMNCQANPFFVQTHCYYVQTACGTVQATCSPYQGPFLTACMQAAADQPACLDAVACAADTCHAICN